LLGRDAGAAPNHRFTSLVLGERDDSIAAGVLATTMFAMAPTSATGPDDPRVISALRVALDRLGGVATTYLAAPPAATAVGVLPDGLRIVLATNGSFESIPMPATLAPIENQETASTRREGATLSFSPDGQRIVVAGPRGLRLYEGPDRRPVTAQVPSVIADASSAAFLADGRLLIAGPNGAMAWTIGAATVVSAGFCTSPVTAVAAAANAPFAACATSDGVVEVWRSDTRQRVAILPHVCNPSRTDVVARNEACEVRFADLRFSDDGRRVAALDDDGVIRLWALNPATAGAQAGARATPAALVISGEPGRVPTSPFDPFPVDAAVSIAFTPDADLLVAVTAGGGLAIHVISPERLAAEICRRLPAGSAPSCPGRAP
jgi:WD40 repeat protein